MDGNGTINRGKSPSEICREGGKCKVEELSRMEIFLTLWEFPTLCTNFKGVLNPSPPPSLYSFVLRRSGLAPRNYHFVHREKFLGIIYPELVQFRNTNLQRLRGSLIEPSESLVNCTRISFEILFFFLLSIASISVNGKGGNLLEIY